MMRTNVFLNIVLLICFETRAQSKWTGAFSGNWQEAANWQPRQVPVSGDDVIFDNSFFKDDYVVMMPDTTVNVHMFSIDPAPGNHIEVVIPGSNKGSPALIINDAGNSFNIKSGGTFRNSSGLSGSQSLQANGLISIYNGGRYIHNTRSSHANDIVAHLAVNSGTTKGIFEFDVPGGSYPISISNRTFGTLMLSAKASGNIQTYNASGSNQATMNGDFVLGEGVQFNLDLTKDFLINNDCILKDGSTFNLASQPNDNSVKVKGNLSQSSSATITESSAGLPVVELCGDRKQLISAGGNISNSITWKINNPQGVALTSPMTLGFKLELIAGILTTSTTSLLVLTDNCLVSGGSGASFVDGPLKKIGDDDFEFPLGKQGDYAPIKMTGAGGLVTDEFVAEYFLGDPAIPYGHNFETPQLVRISKLEYWLLQRLSGSSVKRVGVYVGNYSNATALKDLVLVKWDPGLMMWKNEGNSYYSGVATGTLIGNDLNMFGAFTLGSTVEMQNLLPIASYGFRLSDQSRQDVNALKVSSNGYLQVLSKQNTLATITIMDQSGRLVARIKINLLKGFNNIQILSNKLPRGVYIIGLVESRSGWAGTIRVVKM